MPRFKQTSWLIFSVLSVLYNMPTKAQEVDPGEPLYLTPLIKEGRHEEAQTQALVNAFESVLGYSGFITVNEEYGSNVFFWYFPAEGSQDDGNNEIPVMLWSEGGPGISAFFSLYGQNGPFVGDVNGVNFTLNPHSWHKKYHMIFMDNPVEVGYSHTGNENGYIHSGPEAAKDIYEFLTQFFKMFPNLQKNPFYNGGASYGATYAIQTAHLIHQKNLANPEVPINLTGMVVDSPWIDPYTQSQYGEYFYAVGLLNEKKRDEFIEKEKAIQGLLDEERFLDAFNAQLQLSQRDVFTITGYSALMNIYVNPIKFVNMTEFAISNSTRKALHVGSQPFLLINGVQQSRMHANFMRSSKPELDTLLKMGYRFLLIGGNMDGSTNQLGTQRMIKTLEWEGVNELLTGDREIMKVNDIVSGYKVSSGNATMLFMRNAGHGCIGDQPEWVLDAVGQFL